MDMEGDMDGLIDSAKEALEGASVENEELK
jgi:hypothetical protein